MSNQQLAFFIGLFGSVHCLGMCGPLAFAVPSRHSGKLYVALDKLVYQLGRIISYSVLGLLIGFAGQQLWLAGLQQGVSILSGVLIIMAAGSRLFKRSAAASFGAGVLKPFNRLFSYALKHQANHLITGILNGLLPCGFVYLALIGAVNTGGVFSSAEYMVFFGLGTLPLMLLATFSLSFVKPVFRNRINRAMPYLMLCLGCWFILKGLSLGIPYLSPEMMGSGVECK